MPKLRYWDDGSQQWIVLDANDAETLNGFSSDDFTPVAVTSSTEPVTNLRNGVIWYNPTADEIQSYLGGQWRTLHTSAAALSLHKEVKSYTTVTDTYTVPTGLSSYNKKIDVLMVFQNSVHIREDVDFTITADGSQIQKTSGMWDPDTRFDFVLFGIMDIEGAIEVGLTIASFEKQHTVATNGEFLIPIGIPEYNADTDVLMVTHNNLQLYKGKEYFVTGTHIELVEYTADAGDTFGFIVLKHVRDSYPAGGSVDGYNLLNGSVSDGKLALDNRVGSLAQLQTAIKTSAVAAINEALQEGKKWNGAQYYRQGTEPSTPLSGDQWFNTTTNRLLYYNGTIWVDPLKYS